MEMLGELLGVENKLKKCTVKAVSKNSILIEPQVLLKPIYNKVILFEC